jgi:hypothetical protein
VSHKDKNFQKLQQKWYAKLEKSGFKDIEQDEDNLKRWSSDFTTKKFLDTYEAKADYYYMATQFLNDYKFETQIERVIWEYHAEGISNRNVAKLLKKVKISMSHSSVLIIVSRLKKIMYALYKAR